MLSKPWSCFSPGCCFSLSSLRQHVANCAERLSLVPFHPLGTSWFEKTEAIQSKLHLRWLVHSFPCFSCYVSDSCSRKRSRKALRQNSASALKFCRQTLGCIISLNHLRQGEERDNHVVNDLGHILNHAAWLEMQVFFQLCSEMLDVKWSSAVHNATRKKGFKMSLAAATLCLYSIAMNLRCSLPGYDHLDFNQW